MRLKVERVVVDDLGLLLRSFELGAALEDEAPMEGRWVDRVVGVDGVRVDIAIMRTLDGGCHLALLHGTHGIHAAPPT